jgi:hypothetical protein
MDLNTYYSIPKSPDDALRDEGAAAVRHDEWTFIFLSGIWTRIRECQKAGGC